MKIKHTTILFSLGLVILFATSCSSATDEQPTLTEVPAVQVSIGNPVAGIDNSVLLTGQIESAQSANISTRVMGYITALKVKVGDQVNKGQLLVTISNDDIMARRSQADAKLTEARASSVNAEKDYQRFTNLFKQKSATEKELDNVTLHYQSAKAGVESALQMKAEANAMLAYTNIVAPFSGVVAQKLADAGSMANPGMPILILEQNKNLQVSAVVPETEIGRLKLNSLATVYVNSIDKSFSGSITEISPSSMGTGGQFVVKISIPREIQNGLKAGMYANAKIATEGISVLGNNESVLIPSSAIHQIGQLNALYTKSGTDKALLRYVRLGKTYGDNVEVLSGLSNNESFILSAVGKLYNGVPVKVK